MNVDEACSYAYTAYGRGRFFYLYAVWLHLGAWLVFAGLPADGSVRKVFVCGSQAGCSLGRPTAQAEKLWGVQPHRRKSFLRCRKCRRRYCEVNV